MPTRLQVRKFIIEWEHEHHHKSIPEATEIANQFFAHVSASAKKCPHGGAIFIRHRFCQQFPVDKFITVIQTPRSKVPKQFSHQGLPYVGWVGGETQRQLSNNLSELAGHNYGVWDMTSHIVVLAFTTPRRQ